MENYWFFSHFVAYRGMENDWFNRQDRLWTHFQKESKTQKLRTVFLFFHTQGDGGAEGLGGAAAAALAAAGARRRLGAM